MQYNSRPGAEDYFMMMAQVVSMRGSCSRRKVGCVFVDKNNYVLATGYNGPAKGQKHCTDHNCPGAQLASGTGLEVCEALHAEWNSVLQCRDNQAVDGVYCTTPPCLTCVKLLMNTSARYLIVLGWYPEADQAKAMWSSTGRIWVDHKWTNAQCDLTEVIKGIHA